MSEEQGRYDTEAEVAEAMTMLGSGYEPSVEIEEPRRVTERRDGKLVEVERTAFVKLYTSFKKELRDIKGDELKVWVYLALSINRYTKDARPGLRKIAEDTGISVNTLRNILESLEKRGLLDIEKADGKRNTYRPADYASVSKFDTVGETVSKNRETVSKNRETVSTVRREFAQLEELEELEKDAASPLSQKDIENANKKVDAIIESSSRSKKEGWTGRETFRPDHYPLVDWYHKATGQDCPKSKQKDWHKAVMLWDANNLTVDDLQAAYDMDIQWRGVFTSPNQLTDKAIALKAQGKANKPRINEERVRQTITNIAEQWSGKFVPRPANVERPKGI